MSHFRVKEKKHLDSLNVGDQLPESDFATLTPAGNFIQLEYVEDTQEKVPYKVHPGLFSIVSSAEGLKLKQTSYVHDKILTDFVHTKTISEKIQCFFNRLEIYAKYGIEVPFRAMLLYGPGGTGKTTSIILTCEEYLKDNKTLVVLWPTDKHDPYEVKEFIKTFEYVGIEKLILVAEDIGGVEIDQVKMKSTSSLLSLLDNREKTFKLPTFLIATTNHPEIFLGNLTNRPGRFADKIEVGFPKSSARIALFQFFANSSEKELSEELIEKMSTKKFDDFTADHIREIFLRSDLFGVSIEESMDSLANEIKDYNNAFVKNKKKLGIQEYDD